MPVASVSVLPNAAELHQWKMRDISAILACKYQLPYDCSAAADETGCHIHRLRRIHRPVGPGNTTTMHTIFHWEATDIGLKRRQFGAPRGS